MSTYEQDADATLIEAPINRRMLDTCQMMHGVTARYHHAAQGAKVWALVEVRLGKNQSLSELAFQIEAIESHSQAQTIVRLNGTRHERLWEVKFIECLTGLRTVILGPKGPKP